MNELDGVLETRSADLLDQLRTDGEIAEESFVALIKDFRTVRYLCVCYYVNEYPTMYYFGNPRHTQSMI